MLVIWIVLALVVLAFLGVIVFFFRFAFLRTKILDVDNLDSPVNKPLLPYRDVIEKGFSFIKNQPYETVETKSFDSLSLKAKYYKNDSNKTIILFHGYRSSGNRDFSCAVEMYYKLGLNVLLVDQRAHGESEGKLITFGVKERRDVLTWVEFVLGNKGTDTEIFLGGISMGATTVLLSTGLLLPQNVKGIIADCGFTTPVAIMQKVASDIFKIKGTFLLAIMNLLCIIFGRFTFYGISTVDALKHNKIPVLFIHGQKDNFVPIEMTLEAYNAASCEKHLVVSAEAGHGMSYLLEPERLQKELSEFLMKH